MVEKPELSSEALKTVSIPEPAANQLVQTLADLLEDALHQVWHATQDPESFNREMAWKAYRDIKAKAHVAVDAAFAAADKPLPVAFCLCGSLLWFESERKSGSCHHCATGK